MVLFKKSENDSRKFLRFSDEDVRHRIWDSDLLLFRKRGLIAIAGRSDFSHAAKAAWWGMELFCLEMRELKGGRAVTLASQVEKFPGRIDVYRTNPHDRWPEYKAGAAMMFMRKLAGTPYGYWPLLSAALLHLPIVRLFARPDFNDEANGHPLFCSMACAASDRIGGGVDPVQHLADRFVEPGDLARSTFYDYRFTLIP